MGSGGPGGEAGENLKLLFMLLDAPPTSMWLLWLSSLQLELHNMLLLVLKSVDETNFLLMHGGGGFKGNVLYIAGALERFVGSADEKGMLVAAVASECERAAQIDWAVELYLYAGRPTAAIALINQQLSNALQPALTDCGKGEPHFQASLPLLFCQYMQTAWVE